MDTNPPDGGQSVPPTLPLDMNSILAWLWTVAKAHGLSFALLIVAVLHFHRRTESLESDVKACQEMHLQTVTTQNTALVRALELNTSALTRLETTITTRR